MYIVFCRYAVKEPDLGIPVLLHLCSIIMSLYTFKDFIFIKVHVQNDD